MHVSIHRSMLFEVMIEFVKILQDSTQSSEQLQKWSWLLYCRAIIDNIGWVLANFSWKFSYFRCWYKVAPAKILFTDVMHKILSVKTSVNSIFSMKVTELL